MTIKRRRILVAALLVGMLLTAAAYLWVWPDVCAAWSNPAFRIRLGMNRAQVHTTVGRPPDAQQQLRGLPLIDTWNLDDDQIRVYYDTTTGCVFSVRTKDTPG